MMRDVVWMLISTVAKKEWFFETRAVLAHQSWGRHETLIYVVEETEQTVKRWSGCRAVDMGVPEAPLHKCVGEPAVVLARGCTSRYYGAEGPCCKYDVAVDWFRRSALFGEARYLVFADDDVFFAPGFRAMLAEYPDPESVAFALHPDGYRAIWGHPECQYVAPAARAKVPGIGADGKFYESGAQAGVWGIRSGWFQPAVLSKAAVVALANSTGATTAMRDVCALYGITHDVGFGVLLWELELDVGDFRACAAHESDEHKLRDYVVVHGARARQRPDHKFLNHTALASLFEARGWNGTACVAAHRKTIGGLDTLQGVRETAWFRDRANGTGGHFGPADCAAEQNARRRDSGGGELTCWCPNGRVGGPWPKDKWCRDACPPLKRRRRLAAREDLAESCGGRRWCMDWLGRLPP